MSTLHFKRCIAISPKSGVWAYSSRDAYQEVQGDTVYANFDDFLARHDYATLFNMYAQWRNSTPPKKIQNHVDLAADLWTWLFSRAATMTDGVTKEQELVRSYSMSEPEHHGKRGPKPPKMYRVHRPAEQDKEEFEKILRKLPDQAQKVWDMIESEGADEISEMRMQEIVNERAKILHTKQDPWRIFCYYRPELVRLGYVEVVK